MQEEVDRAVAQFRGEVEMAWKQLTRLNLENLL